MNKRQLAVVLLAVIALCIAIPRIIGSNTFCSSGYSVFDEEGNFISFVEGDGEKYVAWGNILKRSSAVFFAILLIGGLLAYMLRNRG